MTPHETHSFLQVGSRVYIQRKFRNVLGTGIIYSCSYSSLLPADPQLMTVRYTGEVDFEPGYWVGVELDFPAGELNVALL